jgi:hypothetical protein
MIQRCDNFRFSLKAADAIWIARKFVGKDLDGYIAFQFGIARAIHLSHSAFSEQGGDFVRTQQHAN